MTVIAVKNCDCAIRSPGKAVVSAQRLAKGLVCMSRITALSAIEILDSRGRPTVKATCTLESGARAEAAVPSGASTGTAEALELRDGDSKRYQGLGCRKAVENVRTVIHDALVGKNFETQAALD